MYIPLVRKMSALLAHPLSSYSCGHTINFEKSKFFCTKKYERLNLKNLLPFCPQNVCIGQILPFDCGRLLWTASYGNNVIEAFQCSVTYEIN